MKQVIFRHRIPLQIRFNDIDALGHLNNSVYFSFYDLGKCLYFEAVKNKKIDWKEADIVIANINANFLIPIFFDDCIAVETAVFEIGNKSFKVLQQLIDTRTNEVKANCVTIMVGFDTTTQQADNVSDEWKEAICVFEQRDDLRRS